MNPPMNKAIAVAFLTTDSDGAPTGHLKVPCSRYGNNGAECAEVAWQAFEAIKNANGPGDDPFAELDWLMGLTVNNHDDINYIIKEYGL